MKAKTSSRFWAYLIDIILIGILLTFASKVLIDNEKVILLNRELNELSEKMLDDGVQSNENISEYASLIKKIDLENVMFNVVTIVVILIYFVFIPYYNEGQTAGSYFLKIRVIANNGKKLTITKLMLRNFILNGLAYLTTCLTFLYLFSDIVYFVLVAFLSFIQLGLVIVSLFMILYRRDKRGLQDILSETKVVKL
ncbi:MAG: RDD family protein [Bacilli bacterium]